MPKVGIWSGSSVAQAKDVQDGLSRLTNLGLSAVVPRAVRRNQSRTESPARSYLAGPDAAKVQSLVELFAHSELRDILCVRGGYGTLRLLEALEKENLRSPKRIWGFSDLTTLQNYLYLRYGHAWVHSPMLCSLSFRKPRPAENAFWPMNDKDAAKKEIAHATLPHPLRVLERGKLAARGALELPLIGGNLVCFASLLATRWARPARKPFLLFLEEINEKPYRVDRMLTQLNGAEQMQKCRGVVLGQFTECGNAEDIVLAWARERGLPLFAGLRAGHARPNLPLPMGVPVRLELKSSARALLKTPFVRLGY